MTPVQRVVFLLSLPPLACAIASVAQGNPDWWLIFGLLSAAAGIVAIALLERMPA